MRGTPTLNDDGVSVKGCSIIYAPKGQAGEYAPLAANPYRGCSHECRYCYVPNVLRMSRAEFDSSAVPRDNFLDKLRADAVKYQRLGVSEQVMFSFTTDVYNPSNTSLTRPSLETVIDHGMAICVLTKGGTRACRDMDLYRRDRDAFASTLTSLSPAFSKKWEASAALPADRLEALRRFHDAGIFTWVSLEPTLSAEASLAIVEETHPFVDLYKVGKANYITLPDPIDWEEYTHRMIEKLASVGAAHYIKRDLACWLPKGYRNELRVNQFHEPTQEVQQVDGHR